MRFIDWLESERAARGTWADVAAFLGISEVYIHKWRSGNRTPGLESQLLICEKSGGKVSRVTEFVVERRVSTRRGRRPKVCGSNPHPAIS